jgi:hypothetical protein
MSHYQRSHYSTNKRPSMNTEPADIKAQIVHQNKLAVTIPRTRFSDFLPTQTSSDNEGRQSYSKGTEHSVSGCRYNNNKIFRSLSAFLNSRAMTISAYDPILSH